jgi:hypothetical protein
MKLTVCRILGFLALLNSCVFAGAREVKEGWYKVLNPESISDAFVTIALVPDGYCTIFDLPGVKGKELTDSKNSWKNLGKGTPIMNFTSPTTGNIIFKVWLQNIGNDKIKIYEARSFPFRAKDSIFGQNLSLKDSPVFYRKKSLK